jgi:hypothetical protein
MGDLADFLAARIYDDEQLARETTPQQWSVEPGDGGIGYITDYDDNAAIGATDLERALFVSQWDPARVLLECEAKRGILLDYMTRRRRYESEARQRQGASRESFVPPLAYANPWPSDLPLRYLALPYRAHPEYSEAWAPPRPGTVETWGRR